MKRIQLLISFLIVCSESVLLSAQDLEEAKRLSAQVLQFYQEGKFDEAIPIAEKALEIYEALYGEEHIDVAEGLNDVAALYRVKGRYEEAEPLFLRSLDIRTKLLGEDHPAVAESMNNLAALYIDQGRYEEVEALLLQAVEIFKKAHGDAHSTVYTGLNNLAVFYERRGRYRDAEPLYVQTLEMRKKHLGDDHPDVAQSLNNLAVHYKNRGRLNQAESLYIEALRIEEKARGQDHPNVAATLSNLATLYSDQGRYEEAETAYQRAIETYKKSLGEKHPYVSIRECNLATLYLSQGRYSEAEPLFIRAIEDMKQALGDDSPYLSIRLNNLAALYDAQGRFDEAESLYIQALTIHRNALGEQHAASADFLNNLAGHYKNRNMLEKAEPLYQQALEIRNQAFGDDHPDVAESLNNLAMLYRERGEFEKAVPLLEKSHKLLVKLHGDTHPNVAISLNNLALIAYAQGCHEKADSLFLKSLAMRREVLGSAHPDVATNLCNLAALKCSMNDPKQALQYLNDCFDVDQQTITDVFSGASERVKLTFLNTLDYRRDMMMSLIAGELAGNDVAIRSGLDVVLRRKGLVLDALGRERTALLSSDDPLSVQALERLRSVSSQLATLTLAGPGNMDIGEYRGLLEPLKEQKEALEQELARSSLAYAGDRERQDIGHLNVSRMLPPGSALIEIVAYRVYDPGSQAISNERRYLAFILRGSRDSKPDWVDLGNAAPIERAVRGFRNEMAHALERIAAWDEIDAEKTLAEKSKRLYNLVFSPIARILDDEGTLYLSPDGELNLVPFGVFQDESGAYLAEEYRINYVTSGRDMLRWKDDTGDADGDIVIVANPDFEFLVEPGSAEDRKPADTPASPTTVQVPQRSADLREAYWNPLPGTMKEAERIARILGREKVRMYTAGEALEDVVKTLQSPRILHIATHGFFLDDRDASIGNADTDQTRGFLLVGKSSPPLPVRIENPLLRSGLALGGANRLGARSLQEGTEDGILTAFEIAGMNFRGTDLVVLSACETGVGEARIGEGVFGLRRAFQVAGARTVVMSLWKVPDAETRELMVDFYRRLESGESKSGALQDAQLEMLRERRQRYGAAHPFFWGAFVCVGNPGMF